MSYINVTDFFLLIFYLLLFAGISVQIAKKKVEPSLRKFFMNAFWLRMLGSVLYALVHQYYYGYGDTFSFFQGSNFFTDKIREDIANIKYLFSPIETIAEWYNSSPEAEFIFSGYFSNASGNMIMKISAIVSYLAFNRYMIIGLFFGFFSFLGQWKLFEVFEKISDKKNPKLLAFVVLYTPSLWFWGSGLLKDSICLGGLGFIIYYLYKFINEKRIKLSQLLFLVLLLYIVTVIKAYIIIILFASIGLTYLFTLSKRIQNFALRITFFTILLSITIFFGSLIDWKPQVEKVVQESVAQINSSLQNYQAVAEAENSKGAFSIAEIDPSFAGILSNAPDAIFRCLYRPLLWESKSIMILFTSIESTMLLLFTLFLLFKTRIIGFFSIILSNNYLVFCLLLSLMFALIIGFTTFNFGTLIRYKIIFMPFFYFLLAEIYSAAKK